MKKLTLLTLLIVLFTQPGFGQMVISPHTPEGEDLKVPEGWEVRLDDPNEEVIIGSERDESHIYFVNMVPGWHIKTGPAGIFYHPEEVLKGDYYIETKIHLFDPKERHAEGFGLIFGGKNLDNNNHEYLYFLIRNTGDFLVKQRKGEFTRVLKEWTPSKNIIIHDSEETDSTSVNILGVEVVNGMLKFYINETEVASLDAEGYDTDGIFGLRVNHAVDLHVEDLAVRNN